MQCYGFLYFKIGIFCCRFIFSSTKVLKKTVKLNANKSSSCIFLVFQLHRSAVIIFTKDLFLERLTKVGNHVPEKVKLILGLMRKRWSQIFQFVLTIACFSVDFFDDTRQEPSDMLVEDRCHGVHQTRSPKVLPWQRSIDLVLGEVLFLDF